MRKKRLAALAAIAAGLTVAATAAQAQTRPAAGDAAAGRALALWACTGCHIVASDQRFKPIYTGSPHPPDFSAIANEPGLTPASLQHHLETLPAVPKDSRMANPALSSEDLRNVVAFLISLRDKPASP